MRQQQWRRSEPHEYEMTQESPGAAEPAALTPSDDVLVRTRPGCLPTHRATLPPLRPPSLAHRRGGWLRRSAGPGRIDAQELLERRNPIPRAGGCIVIGCDPLKLVDVVRTANIHGLSISRLSLDRRIDLGHPFEEFPGDAQPIDQERAGLSRDDPQLGSWSAPKAFVFRLAKTFRALVIRRELRAGDGAGVPAEGAGIPAPSASRHEAVVLKTRPWSDLRWGLTRELVAAQQT